MSELVADLLKQATMLADKRGTAVYICQEEDGELNAGFDPTKGQVIEIVNPNRMSAESILRDICKAKSQAEIVYKITIAKEYLGWNL